MNVTTAIIMASGFGSRMLPITGGVQKELLPILSRPVIDYVVEDAVKAGVKRIIFIVRPGTHALQDFYNGLPALRHHLERFGKTEALELLESVHNQAIFDFIEQPEGTGYGTAIPVKTALPHLSGNETVIVSTGDDFLFHQDGTSEFSLMIDTFKSAGGEALITGIEYPEAEIHKYGVIKPRVNNDHEYLDGFVEKPAPGTAPSNLANLSKYIMTPTALSYVKSVAKDEKSGEYYIPHAVLACAQDHPVAVHRAKGRYLDSGSMETWLEANLVVAAADPKLKQVVRRAQENL